MFVSDARDKPAYDVIVVGGGPAGCSAAYFAAQAGFHVLLLEKSGFPRDKVCGDGVSPRALAILDRIGISGPIETEAARRITEVIVSSPNGAVMRSRIPHVDGFRDYGIVLPRKVFDTLLFYHTCSLDGVDAIQRCTVNGLLYEGQDICGVRALRGSTRLELKAGHIVGADGVHSVIAREMSLSNRMPRHRAFGVRAYFEDVPDLRDGLEIHYDETVLPGYAWVFPTGEREANIGVGVIGRHGESRGIRLLFQSFVENSPAVRERLRSADMVEDSLRGWPITMGSFAGGRGKKNVVVIGDAGSMTDPMTGEGIYTALRSGELSARALDLHRGRRQGNVCFSTIYERLWRREFRWREFGPGFLYQTLLGSRAFVNLAVSRAAGNPKRASVLAGAIIHLLPKRRLFSSL